MFLILITGISIVKIQPMQQAWSNYPHQTAILSKFHPLRAKVFSNALTLRVSQLKVCIEYTYYLFDIISKNRTWGIRRKRASKDDCKVDLTQQ
ncbi:hypothetical protein DJ494_27585 [Klebsiella pneumoniae]|nr:hypothetical protein DJ512_27720 [Klebsiella pneumoniae]TYE17863.1 hypothetical protein DJ494_27585 [Klebsiella pneumoniae]